MGRTDLVGIGRRLRRAGLKVKATEGWRGRGRPYAFEPRGTVFHHTASSRHGGDAPSLGVVTYGRAGIPGPLCNVLIARDGTCYLIAAGYANHAGYGGPLRGIPENSANRYTVGFEVENDGVGEPWSPELLRACHTAFAVTHRFLETKARLHFGHKEWAPDRKIDPARLDMNLVRRRVKKLLRRLALRQGRLGEK